MQRETDYLLKYIKKDTYQKILIKNHCYMLEDLINNRVDVELNIRYLMRIGVKNIDQVLLERLDDLLLANREFIKKMDTYEEKLTKQGLIDMLENS